MTTIRAGSIVRSGFVFKSGGLSARRLSGGGRRETIPLSRSSGGNETRTKEFTCCPWSETASMFSWSVRNFRRDWPWPRLCSPFQSAPSRATIFHPPAADATTSTSFANTPFYVDFRTRPDFTIHTFLQYGAQDSSGRPLERKTVGFYLPNALGALFGIVAFPGEIGAED
jgi:hypothetical protein